MSIKFENLKQDFIRLIKNDNLFHAYVFFGESLESIFDFSKMLANFLETGKYEKSGNFLNDFISISPNEYGNIGIDEVRQIQGFLYQSPVISKKRVVVIYGAEALTAEAQGGILKIIEEPPKDSLVILIASQESALLDTLRSRAHKVYFHLEKTRNNAEKKIAPKDAELKDGIEDVDEFFKKILVDLRKNLSQNSDIVKEVLKRLALIKQYNLNNKLQIKLLNYYLKNKK